MAIVSPGKWINEGEISRFGDLPEKMVFRNQAVEGELIV
jgi:hypothetical protein